MKTNVAIAWHNQSSRFRKWSLKGGLRPTRVMALRGFGHLSFLILFSISAFSSPTKPSVDVWAIGEGIRINPQTNKAYEDNTIYDHDLKGNYRDQSSVWDRAQSLVHLT